MSKSVKKENGKKSESQPLSRRTKMLTTSAILFGNVTFGCCLNAYSPALDYMRSKYKTTIDDIAVLYTISTILYCIGAIACGFTAKYINRQLLVIFCLFGMALSMCMTPYCPTKTMFFVLGGLLGFSSGFYDSSQMVWMIELWQHKAGPLIQAQHFAYAVGAIIPSVLVAPFLGKFDHSHVNATESLTIDSRESIESETKIHIPFLIIGGLNLLTLIFQFFLFTFYRYHTPPMYANENFELIDDAKNIPSPIRTDLHGNVSINQQEAGEEENVITLIGVSKRKLKLIKFTTLFLGAYQAMEVSTLQFLPIFGQYSDLRMSEASSAYVLTGLIIMYAVGRFMGIIVIFKVRPELILITNFIFIITGNLLLLIWANSNLTMFWIGSMILGAGYSTMFPSFCAFIEKYLVFTSSVASCIIVFGASTSSIYPIIIGRLIEHRSVILTYTNFASTAICVVALLWGYSLTRNSVNRER